MKTTNNAFKTWIKKVIINKQKIYIPWGHGISTRKNMWKFQGSISTNVEFLWVLVFDLGLEFNFQGKGVSHNFVWNFQEWKFDSSRNSKGKVTNLKFPGEFSESISSTPLGSLQDWASWSIYLNDYINETDVNT